MIGHVVLIEFASGQDGNAESLKIIWSDIVAGSRGPSINRQDVAVRTRVKHVSGGGRDQWDIAADRSALDTWNRAQRSQSLFPETVAGGQIGILSLGQSYQAGPG